MSGKQPDNKACLPCRKVKMKCVTGGGGGSRCDRCSRKSLQCVFRDHCRGRKPGMRCGLDPQPEVDFWAESDGYQPHSLLNHQAMKGKFSLQNILSIDEGLAEHAPSSPESVSPDDPISLGLLNIQVASCLVQSFMQRINPYISQLDPVLHSFTYLRKSPFLLTSILAVAAKAFESALYPALRAHAESLYADCFRRGEKSTEIIQAILLLTYWKEPNDTRAWTSVGLAIRLALDLNWHKIPPHAAQRDAASEIQRREIRNVQRTFLVLFVYDRSLSLQTGKPWMIERNEMIESVHDWWQDRTSFWNDRLLCAFAALRLITADAFDLLGPSKTHPTQQVDRLLAILDRRIHDWETKWLAVVSRDQAQEQDQEQGRCHSFLIKYYGLHARLQVFTVPLQKARIQPAGKEEMHGLKPFWLSYQSALEMLQLAAESPSVLYLAQDSVHVMTAYAAIFLIKILLSSPFGLAQEIESPATTAIRDAADTFAGLSAAPNPSCSLQARFLDNILVEYARIRHQYPDIIHSRRGKSSTARQELYSAGNNQAHLMPTPSSPSLVGQNQPHRDSANTTTIADFGFDHLEHASEPDFGIGLGGTLLGDEDMWDDMFATAGFSIQDAVFFS
ncbi:fungal-specific transcription factor domain-containing protein [Aspergillus californicus]